MGITPHALERGGGINLRFYQSQTCFWAKVKKHYYYLPPDLFYGKEEKSQNIIFLLVRIGPLLGLLCRGGMSVKVSLAYKFFFHSLVRIYPPRHILGKARVKQGEGGKKIVERRYHYLPPQIFSPYPPAPRPPQTSHFGGIAHPQEISQLPPPFKIAAIAKQSAFMSQSEKHARIDYNYALHFNIMYIIHPI